MGSRPLGAATTGLDVGEAEGHPRRGWCAVDPLWVTMAAIGLEASVGGRRRSEDGHPDRSCK